MGNTQLIISLLPNMLGVALVRKDQVIQEERVDLDPGQWDQLWEDGLLHLGQPLRQLLSRFGRRRFPKATLIYQSPSVVQQVHTQTGSPKNAAIMAVSKIRENVGFSSPVETCLLAHSSGEQESSTLLVYSEREEQLRALYAWANRCHVTISSFVPTSTEVVWNTTEIAAKTDPETAVFYLGVDVSGIAFYNESGLQLVRTAELGYRALMEGYSHALAQDEEEGDDAEDHKDTHEDHARRAACANESYKMLFEHGIPFSRPQGDEPDFHGMVMPVIAPVLQRLCIEIKQTFRFGLGDAKMPKYLMICGPGAAIPNLSKALSQHLDMHIKVDTPSSAYSPSSEFGLGAPGWSLVGVDSPINGLLPAIASDTLVKAKLSKALVAGGAIAAILIGAEYQKATSSYEQTQQQISLGMSRVEALQDFREQLEDAAEVSVTISGVSSLVVDTIVTVPVWHHTLASFSDLVPESIRVNEIQGNSTQQDTYIEINGLAVADSEKTDSYELNQFVDKLKSISGVEKVTMGSTTRVSVGDDQWGRQFTLKIQLVADPLPFEALVQAD